MPHWVPKPDRFPFKCPVTHLDGEQDGPYYAFDLHYYEMVVDPDGRMYPGRNPNQLYLSPQAIKELAYQDGSPIVVLDRAAEAERERERAKVAQDLTKANLRVAELEAEIDRVRKGPVDIDALADFLDNRYQRKAAPRKKAT